MNAVANPEQVAILKSGVDRWNSWRRGDENATIDLREADLSKLGSERESDGRVILGCFLDRVNSDEFDVSHGHPLGLQ